MKNLKLLVIALLFGFIFMAATPPPVNTFAPADIEFLACSDDVNFVYDGEIPDGYIMISCICIDGNGNEYVHVVAATGPF